jgi:site-specific recombinase XerD
VEESHAERFIRNHLTHCRHGDHSKSSHVAAAVHCFMDFLSSRGLLTPLSETACPYQKLLEDYLDHLKHERNLAQSTIQARRHCLIPFLEDLGADAIPGRLGKLRPERIQSFLARDMRTRSQPMRRMTQATLRTFFRFCIQRGYVKHDLAQAVPCVRTYKLSGIPRAVSEEDAQKILLSINRTTAVGRRDFAIIQLLYTYGVRGGQVRALKLQDIEWRQSRIRFPGLKGGKEIFEPLTDEVGQSILEYLRYGRPKAAYSEVFLTAHAPVQPLRNPSVMSCLVYKRMRQAEISGPIRGSHAFRHHADSRIMPSRWATRKERP